MKKNLLYSVLIAVCLFGSMFNAAAYNFPGGDGTQSNPYQVASKADLTGVKDYIGTAYKGTYFKQTADIILGTWTPIATLDANPFCGNYNGNGYKLSNIVIDAWCPTVADQRNYFGVFGIIGGGATIENVHLDGGHVSVSNDDTHIGYSYVGGIVGYTYSNGGGNIVIRNCSNTAAITNNAAYAVYAGGITGYVYSTANNTDGSSVLIANCRSDAEITATACVRSGAAFYVGGIVGRLYMNSKTSGAITVEKCFTAGSIDTRSGTTLPRSGGICGYLNALDGTTGDPLITIRRCVTALDSINTDGTVRRVYGMYTNSWFTVNPNYAYADMLIKGAKTPSVSASGYAGLDKTLAELHAKATYEALLWDFDTDWTIEEGVSFPQLKTGGSTGTHSPKVAGALTASSSNGVLTVKGVIAGKIVSIYNIMGQLVVKRKATGTEESFGLPAAGIYLISSGNQTIKTVSK